MRNSRTRMVACDASYACYAFPRKAQTLRAHRDMYRLVEGDSAPTPPHRRTRFWAAPGGTRGTFIDDFADRLL
jgi:hypothetical protein